MDGGKFPGVSANCRRAGRGGEQRGEGEPALMLAATCYSNQTHSLIQMTPDLTPHGDFAHGSLAVTQAGPSVQNSSQTQSWGAVDALTWSPCWGAP